MLANHGLPLPVDWWHCQRPFNQHKVKKDLPLGELFA